MRWRLRVLAYLRRNLRAHNISGPDKCVQDQRKSRMSDSNQPALSLLHALPPNAWVHLHYICVSARGSELPATLLVQQSCR